MKKNVKVITFLLTLVMAFSLFIGCGKKEVSVKDRAGNEVVLPTKIEKIISTAPSNTEILIGLGLGDKLVAVDNYSEGIEGLKADIKKLDFVKPNGEEIIGLMPDLIVASGHNVSDGTDPFAAIKEAGIPVVYIPSSESIAGVQEDIKFIADVTGTKAKGDELVSNMNKEIDKVKEIAKNITEKKNVYFEIGPAPHLYSFGNSTFLNEMIEVIGAKNVFADQKAWIAPTSEAVVAANPDVILTNVDYVPNPTEEIKSRAAWGNITAVKNNDVKTINSNTSSRPSQHITKALVEMAKAVYPEYYDAK